MLFLTESDVKRALQGPDVHREAVEVIEEILRQQSAGSTFQLKRTTMDHPDHPGHLWHNIRVLPGMAPEQGAAAVRVYSGYRGTNKSEVICLFDWSDMEMVSIISDYHLHAIRTAAPYGVAAKYLSRADSRTLGIIGTGRYAKGIAQAICAVRDITRINVYSRNPDNVAAFCDSMRAELGIAVEPAQSPREAVRGADIMVTATSGNNRVFEGEWLEPGVLFMSLAAGEFDEETVLRSRVILSGIDQALGDSPPRKPFPALLASGKFSAADVAAEFCDVVSGKKPGRRSADEIILYECPGMAILDVGVGQWVYQRARAAGLGTELPFGEEDED